MRKLFVFLFVLTLPLYGWAQETAPNAEELAKRNWFHSDYSQTGIYGIGTDAALEFLQSKNLKPKTVIVGVLDSGVEIDHEDLKDNIWKNKKEKSNGKDSDRNGYVDDLHGWNFVADASGNNYNEDTYEATRVTLMYTPLFDSGNKEADMENMKKYPGEYQTYLRARKDWAENYYPAKARMAEADDDSKAILDALEELENYAGDIKLTSANVAALPEETSEQKANKERLEFLLENNSDYTNKTLAEITAEAKKALAAGGRTAKALRYAYNLEYDPTHGKVDKKGYGNNDVQGPEAFHGTHVAGIIAAQRNNEIGMNGVAGNLVQIMSVRAVPDGDERDEDVANAIIYAVDNGAKILNMSFGKAFSPNKEMVYDAIKYADKKGVLMFHAAGNSNKDLDNGFNYPSNYLDDEMTPFTKNWITVGASARNPEQPRAYFSNYGTVKVDFFAPGTEIYSTVPSQKYRYAQGTSMASPVAAGAAALIWAYFPEMTSEQVKEVLFETVNIPDVTVTVGSEGDQRKFSDLSATGGIIDVNKAVRLAYDRYGKK